MSSQVAAEKLAQHTIKTAGGEPLTLCDSGRIEVVADPRLIAAAPDLLAALKIVDENISGFIRMGLNEAETETVAWIQNTVRSAIASAEGI